MNNEIEIFARKKLKKRLKKLPAGWVHKFKQMYSHNNLTKSINSVVDGMDVDKLDWAMTQVSRSLENLKKEGNKHGTNEHHTQ